MGGRRCKRMREILQQYGEHIGMVLILGGTNDLGDDDLTPGLTIGNIKQLHSMVHAIGARSGVLTLPDCTAYSTELIPKPYKEVLNEINADLRNFAATSDSMFLVDIATALPWLIERVRILSILSVLTGIHTRQTNVGGQ